MGTPAILASGRLEPRRVIGSIDTSEFLVSLAASIGFLLALGSQGINATWVVALLIGGAIAAPIAAWLVRHVPPRVLGSAVGGVIILTNSRTLLRSDWIDAPEQTRYAVYAFILVLWAAAVAYSVRAHLAERHLDQPQAAAAHRGAGPRRARGGRRPRREGPRAEALRAERELRAGRAEPRRGTLSDGAAAQHDVLRVDQRPDVLARVRGVDDEVGVGPLLEPGPPEPLAGAPAGGAQRLERGHPGAPQLRRLRARPGRAAATRPASVPT